MNVVVLCGNLTRDGELRTTQSGLNVFSFTLAVTRKYQKEDGEKEADFINCKAFNKTAENMAKYTKKGSKVLVEGRIEVSKYQDAMGETKYATNILVDNCTFLSKKEEEATTQSDTTPRMTQREVIQSVMSDDEEDDFNDSPLFSDDDLPF